MADVSTIIMLVCLAIVACVGTVLNGFTLYALTRNKMLKKNLASVRWLMFGQSFCEGLVCCVGVPLQFANLLIGTGPPFTTIPTICHMVELVMFGASYVAIWYQTLIALTRLAAVVAPNWYRQYFKQSKVFYFALLLFPWIIEYIGYVVEASVRSYDIHPTPGSGMCVANEYDDSPEGLARFGSYVLADMFLHIWIPMSVGLIAYAIIYTRKWWSSWKKRGQTEPTSTLPGGTQATKLGNEVEMSLVAVAPAKSADEQITEVRTPQTQHVQRATGPQTKHPSKTEKEREQKIKLFAIAYLVSCCLFLPSAFAWGLDYYTYLAENVPVVARILDVSGSSTFAATPIVYILVSKDFRKAFREIVQRLEVILPQVVSLLYRQLQSFL